MTRVRAQPTNLRMQRGSGDSEEGRGGDAPFIERNPDNVASTLEYYQHNDESR